MTAEKRFITAEKRFIAAGNRFMRAELPSSCQPVATGAPPVRMESPLLGCTRTVARSVRRPPAPGGHAMRTRHALFLFSAPSLAILAACTGVLDPQPAG